MQLRFAIFALAVLPLSVEALTVSHRASFGPENCVKLTRSSAGSCVITTNCQGLDTSKTEFAFDCVGGEHNNGEIVRHSFGVGGFEANEEFDTEVKCGRCTHVPQGLPPPVPATIKKAAHKAVKKEVVRKPTPQVAQAATEAAEPLAHPVPEAPKAANDDEVPAVSFKVSRQQESRRRKTKPEVVEYGPDNCVSVYRSDEGHCIMRTDCQKSTIVNYEFGLVCVNKQGFGQSSPVKHLFGKNSFDPEETFDTLIKCDQCLGLEDIPDKVALAGEVATMAKDLNGLKETMKNISINVNMLNEKVFAAAPPAPPVSAPAPAVASAPAAAALVHATVDHRRTHLRHGHRRHHHHRRHRDEDDDDDEEGDSDYDDDEDDSREEKPRDEDVQQVSVANNANAVPVVTQVESRSAENPYGDDDREDEDGFD